MMRWHRDLHKKMLLGGRIFQTGLLLVLLSSILKLFLNAAFLEVALLSGLVFTLIGTLVTYTNSNKVRVELVIEPEAIDATD